MRRSRGSNLNYLSLHRWLITANCARRFVMYRADKHDVVSDKSCVFSLPLVPFLFFFFFFLSFSLRFASRAAVIMGHAKEYSKCVRVGFRKEAVRTYNSSVGLTSAFTLEDSYFRDGTHRSSRYSRLLHHDCGFGNFVTISLTAVWSPLWLNIRLTECNKNSFYISRFLW